jgi:hypothetical protein
LRTVSTFHAGSSQATTRIRFKAKKNNVQVTKLDAGQVQHRHTVGANQAVEGEDLVHLDRRNKRTTTLANDVAD